MVTKLCIVKIAVNNQALQFLFDFGLPHRRIIPTIREIFSCICFFLLDLINVPCCWIWLSIGKKYKGKVALFIWRWIENSPKNLIISTILLLLCNLCAPWPIIPTFDFFCMFIIRMIVNFKRTRFSILNCKLPVFYINNMSEIQCDLLLISLQNLFSSYLITEGGKR